MPAFSLRIRLPCRIAAPLMNENWCHDPIVNSKLVTELELMSSFFE